MKILVIFTGGTIGSTLSDGWISPDKSTKRELIENYKGEGVTFEIAEPYSILSENLSAKNINMLVETVCNYAKGDYDGIIVTHGTDTLQYSSTALSYALGTDSIPVMLVSANYPLNNPLSNGNENFAQAVRFIKEKKGQGVFVAYRNDDGVVYFHRGHRVIEHREADDSVFSLNGDYYAKATEKEIEIGYMGLEFKGLGVFTLEENSHVLVIHSHPGDDFNYDLKGKKSVIIKPYHSGTLNTSSESLKAFCERAKNENIPVYVVNIKQGESYESTKEFTNMGIIPLRNTTLAGIYMRNWIFNNLSFDDSYII